MSTIGASDADFIRCRVMRHSWDDYSPVGMRNPSWGTRVSLRCLRCGAERHDIYNALGDVGYRRYIYPPGYQYARHERPSAAEFRILLMKQMRKERRQARGQVQQGHSHHQAAEAGMKDYGNSLAHSDRDERLARIILAAGVSTILAFLIGLGVGAQADDTECAPRQRVESTP